jgi:hypothetical protein
MTNQSNVEPTLRTPAKDCEGGSNGCGGQTPPRVASFFGFPAMAPIRTIFRLFCEQEVSQRLQADLHSAAIGSASGVMEPDPYEALDLLAGGVLIVGADGRIRHADRTAVA